MQQFWFQSAVWIMSSNIFHTTNTTPVLNIIRTTTTAVFKLQYPPSLKYPQQFFQDILVHNQSISIMNSQEREAFHITLTFLVGLAFLLVAAVVIYFLHLLYRFVVEHQCRCLCTRTQQRELNNSGKTHKISHPALHACVLTKKNLYRIPISGIYYFFSWPLETEMHDTNILWAQQQFEFSFCLLSQILCFLFTKNEKSKNLATIA